MKKNILTIGFVLFTTLIWAYNIEPVENPTIANSQENTVIIERSGYAELIDHGAWTEVFCAPADNYCCYTVFLFPDGTYSVDYNTQDGCGTIDTNTRPVEKIDPVTGRTYLEVIVR